MGFNFQSYLFKEFSQLSRSIRNLTYLKVYSSHKRPYYNHAPSILFIYFRFKLYFYFFGLFRCANIKIKFKKIKKIILMYF
jgi:hypothetical protein